MSTDLTGRRTLVTGATGGIGMAITRALHARGASLAVTGRRLEQLEQLRDELGERVDPLPADLSSRPSAPRTEGSSSTTNTIADALFMRCPLECRTG